MLPRGEMIEFDAMTKSEAPVTIKRYAERRLYRPGTGSYVTLRDLAAMVEDEEDFTVFDAKSGEDITRSVLKQIIRGRASHGQV